jgi:uncharacterized membrane protein
VPFSVVGVFLRGLLMGAADIIPGVSGGTMAFITGIYDTLLGAIRSFDIHFLAKLFRLDIAGAWKHVNGTFLLALLLGIATSIFSLARLVSWLLEAHPVPLWAFFFGLILASALVLLWEVRHWSAAVVLSLLVGIGIALLIAFSPAIRLDFGLAGVFLAGFVAICAMILPGISGSFVLVLLGMYGPVLEAIKGFDLVFILVFVLGCGSGLLCFSRRPALVAASLSPGHHGAAHRIPVWFAAYCVAVEACGAVGRGQPRRVAARTTIPRITRRFPHPFGTGSATVVRRPVGDDRVRPGLADTRALGSWRSSMIPGMGITCAGYYWAWYCLACGDVEVLRPRRWRIQPGKHSLPPTR